MRRALHGGYLLLGLCAGFSSALGGCSSDDSTTVRVTVSPDPLDVLTCSTQDLTATVSGGSSNDVAWSVSPDMGSGTIDDTGSYTAPNATPIASTSVTATSQAQPLAKATVGVTLATAFPGAAQTLTGSLGIAALGGAGTYAHVVAARGSRVYVAWPDDSDDSRTALEVARSDDGGATWNPAVDAISAALTDDSLGGAGGIECPAIAIDAGNPDIVYAIGHGVAENEYAQPLDGTTSGSQTQLFAVSTDAGVTWTTSVLHVGASGDVCADIASPSPDNVVVVSPGWSCMRGDSDLRDLFVWADANQGAGFADGTYTDNPVEYFANGYADSLDNLAGDDCSDAHITPESDGSTDGSGDATESPRLFSDGAGNLCITYVGDVRPKNGDMVTSVYAQCSSDGGQTFTVPQAIDDPPIDGVSSATGAFGPGGVAAIAYTTAGSPDGYLYVALSSDGQTFGAPVDVPAYFEANDDTSQALNPALAYDTNGVLWIAYRTVESGTLVVDKSCDGGQTFSGRVAVTNGTPTLKWPTFAMTDAAAPPLIAWGDDHISTFTLAPEQ